MVLKFIGRAIEKLTMKRQTSKINPEKNAAKHEEVPEVALAAIASYRKQREVSDFINFMLDALERNSSWLNGVVGKQSNFRCALMIGAGPNRFQIQEIIYPSSNDDIKLEIQLNESEDHDKIALAALMKLSDAETESVFKYVKSRMTDNPQLKQDLLKGKGLGISFAVLRPINHNQYRLMDRIVIGNSMKSIPQPISLLAKTRRSADKTLAETITRKPTRRM